MVLLSESPATGSTAKFVAYGTALGLIVDVVAYPAELVKTHLQVARQVCGSLVPARLRRLTSLCAGHGNILEGYDGGGEEYMAQRGRAGCVGPHSHSVALG